MEIADNIKRIRQLRHKTQAEVAEESGILLDTYRQIEQGRIKEMGVFKAAAIAEALGVSITDLLSNSESRSVT